MPTIFEAWENLEERSVADKTRELCKWKSDAIAENLPTIVKIVSEPAYVCLKCGRAATKRKWLCKPEKLARHLKGSN